MHFLKQIKPDSSAIVINLLGVNATDVLKTSAPSLLIMDAS